MPDYCLHPPCRGPVINVLLHCVIVEILLLGIDDGIVLVDPVHVFTYFRTCPFAAFPDKTCSIAFLISASDGDFKVK